MGQEAMIAPTNAWRLAISLTNKMIKTETIILIRNCIVFKPYDSRLITFAILSLICTREATGVWIPSSFLNNSLILLIEY